jgi:lipopolysaccharide transport system ATP-binding protein
VAGHPPIQKNGKEFRRSDLIDAHSTQPMSDIVIAAENLSKSYLVGHQCAQRERYTALRDVIAREIRTVARKTVDVIRGMQIMQGDEVEEFWALKDVSFEVQRGEAVGIIGRNGAGKSTLLKILSRITEPTEGRVTIRGRAASLLEVGTGFHPELTGRENIYLNGAILGMKRAEIIRKFDEIVAFAEVERFLDTPVKRYSSGMYVRLAFAVAAHLEPEILVVDEVLAVGDAEFQKKCLGKMSEVVGGGRTILFVSHNMAAIEALCPRSLYLVSGALLDDSSTKAVIATYLSQKSNPSRGEQLRPRVIQDGLQLKCTRLSTPTLRSGEPLDVEFQFRADEPGQLRECAVLVYSAKGMRLAIVDLRECRVVPLRYAGGEFAIRMRITSLPLVEGDLTLGLYLVTNQFAGNLLDLAELTIVPSQSTARFIPYPADARGLLVLNATTSVVIGEPLAPA